MTPKWVDVNERQPEQPGIYLVVDEETNHAFAERTVFPGHWLENPVDIKKEEDVENQTS